MSERTIWIVAGLVGLAVAVALALLTSHVSQPSVGLPGEPVSAGRQLAPARTATTTASAAAEPEQPTAARTTTSAQPPARSDDDDAGDSSGDDGSGRGRGRNRGRGGDD
jgi:hypothetical protein